MHFLDQNVVITGGNSGIGRAAAGMFANEGAQVSILGRNKETLKQTIEEFNIKGQAVDVTDRAALDSFFSTTAKKNGPINVLFANAGIAEFLPFEYAPEDHFKRLMDVNFHGTVNTLSAALPHLANGASVIITTSIANQMGEPNSAAYAASKAAVKSLISTLSSELATRHIRINAVSPGPTVTPIFSKMGLVGDAFEQTRAAMSKAIPAGRMGTDTDQAAAVLFLASNQSSFVVGQELVVDGGITGCVSIT